MTSFQNFSSQLFAKWFGVTKPVKFTKYLESKMNWCGFESQQSLNQYLARCFNNWHNVTNICGLKCCRESKSLKKRPRAKQIWLRNWDYYIVIPRFKPEPGFDPDEKFDIFEYLANIFIEHFYLRGFFKSRDI